MNQNLNDYKPQGKDYAKFIIPSLLGAFLFLTPIPVGAAFNIPLGMIIDWLTGILSAVSFGTYAPDTMAGDFGLHYMIGLVCVTIAFVGMILATVLKLDFIMSRPMLKKTFYTPSPIYFVTKTIGFLFIWMIFLNIGPAAVIGSYTGDVMVGLFAALVVIFIVLVPGIPLLTDFGLMEFIGIFIKKVVRTLFTLPGRASVDLVASWFGSSVASVIITRTQHERGFYTDREAACATVNFAIVSVPFTFVVARTAGLTEHFLTFYFIMAIVVIFLAILMPRIWPLRNIPDTYLEGVEKQIDEEVPTTLSSFEFATRSACQRAQKTTAKDIVDSSRDTYCGIFFDLLPIILAWGTLAMMVVELTPFFDYVAWPMAQFLQLLQVPEATAYAHLTLVGFVDMFIPALLMGDAPLQTRMILGILSVVQVIYLAETGALILKSKIPLNIGHLFALFMMRTIIGLPLIVLFVNLFM
ncbi:MAG: hypothetical protein FWE68_05780 [Defluviitaleaceae bacterium]|nr:hypothetical protein [Defluviitaleaceae bacterium]